MYSRTLAASNEIDSRDETSIKHERTRPTFFVVLLRFLSVVSPVDSTNSRDNRIALVRSVGLAGVSFFSQTVALYSFPDYYPEEDDGNWTCVAGLMGKNDFVEEAWDQLEVRHVSKNTISKNTISVISRLTIVAIGITLIIFVFGGLVYAWRRYMLRRSSSGKLPAYSTQENYSSKSPQSNNKFNIRECTDKKDKC